MTSLKGLLRMAIKTTEELLAEIAKLHSEADIEQEVTDKVTAAVQSHVDETVAAAVAPLNDTIAKNDADNKALIQAIVDKLAAEDVAGATSVATAALAGNPPAEEAKSEGEKSA